MDGLLMLGLWSVSFTSFSTSSTRNKLREPRKGFLFRKVYMDYIRNLRKENYENDQNPQDYGSRAGCRTVRNWPIDRLITLLTISTTNGLRKGFRFSQGLHGV